MKLDAFEAIPDVRALLDSFPSAGSCVRLPPLPGGASAAVALSLADLLRDPLLVVTETPAEAERIFGDLQTFDGGPGTTYFPQRETLPYEDSDPHVEISGQRVEALRDLLAGRVSVLVSTARALAERMPLTGDGGSIELSLNEGAEMRLSEVASRLETMGFEPVHTIQELGEFAVRGGIVDVFPYGHDFPLRIELWGDEIESIRRFDLLTQRSIERVDRVEILPVTLRPQESGAAPDFRSLLELLPPGTVAWRMAPRACR